MMKTNNIIKGLAVILIFMGTASCSSFLDEKNWSSQTPAELFPTKDGFEALVNGAYSRLRSVYNSKDYLSLTWMGTDIITQNRYDQVTAINQYTAQFDKSNGSVYTYWTNLYGGIKGANAVIDRAPKALIDDAVRIQRVAEAKFLRALFYFEIVRNWGDAPLIDFEVTEPIYEAERTPASTIYDLILADLNEAVKELPVSQTGNNFGRASKSAAKHLRALVYLTRGYQTYAQSTDFQNAYKDAVGLIEGDADISSPYHKLLNDFGLVHRQSNETNEEILFSVQWGNDEVSGRGNTLNKYFIFPYREGYTGGSKDNYYGNDDATFVPTKFTYMLFDWTKDTRAKVTFMSAYNGNTGTSIDGRNAGKNWMQATAAVTGTYAVGDATILFPTPAHSATPPTDKIKSATVTINYPTGNPRDFSPTGTGNDYWKMGGTPNTSAVNRTFLPVWKFKDSGSYFLENNNSTGIRDTYLFRLAETYLIASEAALKNNDNANALKYLNKIRERAETNNNDLQYPAGTPVTIDMILDERALELFGESSRWNDLQRTGKLVERARTYNWDITNESGGAVTQLTEGSTKFYLRPIPLTWINSLRNGQQLANNPGW
jgi:hypothetical protein